MKVSLKRNYYFTKESLQNLYNLTKTPACPYQLNNSRFSLLNFNALDKDIK